VKAVVNTSPLVFISKLGYLALLKTIFQSIHVPMAVFRELSAKKDEVYQDTEMLIEESFMVVEEVEPTMTLTNLHTGEAEAITLAKRLNYWVVLDDSKARGIAMKEGLRVIGTVGLLKVMLRKGLIEEKPEDLFGKLAVHGFRMKREVFFGILKDNGH
jgi:predicted nucleic acid-binding protein